jgi:hypothetical protein
MLGSGVCDPSTPNRTYQDGDPLNICKESRVMTCATSDFGGLQRVVACGVHFTNESLGGASQEQAQMLYSRNWLMPRQDVYNLPVILAGDMYKTPAELRWLKNFGSSVISGANGPTYCNKFNYAGKVYTCSGPYASQYVSGSGAPTIQFDNVLYGSRRFSSPAGWIPSSAASDHRIVIGTATGSY